MSFSQRTRNYFEQRIILPFVRGARTNRGEQEDRNRYRDFISSVPRERRRVSKDARFSQQPTTGRQSAFPAGCIRVPRCQR